MGFYGALKKKKNYFKTCLRDRNFGGPGQNVDAFLRGGGGGGTIYVGGALLCVLTPGTGGDPPEGPKQLVGGEPTGAKKQWWVG